jgi:hypothetical protein
VAKQFYVNTRFNTASKKLIALCEDIMRPYIEAGYTLTVRQLYYQLVARDHIPNTERSYKNITRLINDARLAGLIDWDWIEDRTRALKGRSAWTSGRSILQACVDSFHMDMWESQECRVYVVVEKDALAGVVNVPCFRYDVPMLAARGYPSASALRDAVVSYMLPAAVSGQRIKILHLGDHDPSGIDMSRDLEDRITMFGNGTMNLEFRRIALNMDQVEEVNPPENPAKTTDTRFEEYRRLYGESSWELDALNPEYLDELISRNIQQYIDEDAWQARKAEIETVRDKLKATAKAFKL